MSTHAPANSPWPSPLVIGGHSFISDLGNEPALSPAQQVQIVAACLDQGVTGIDTTYEPERLALGQVWQTLNRRHEATILAWNFFRQDHGNPLGPPRAYQPDDLSLMQDQLHTDHIDLLVVHEVPDAGAHRRQEELARRWRDAGRVKALGAWAPKLQLLGDMVQRDLYQFMVTPHNIHNAPAALLEGGRDVGWRVFATSPFIRGWMLDRFVAAAVAGGQGDEPQVRARAAAGMLRYSWYGSAAKPLVDHVIIGFRQPRWISANLAALARGPLPAEELAWLRHWHAVAEEQRKRAL